MRRFSAEQALAMIELEQVLIDYWHEIDTNAGRNAADFYTPDCTARIGPMEIEGSDGVARYYTDRAARAIDASGAVRLGRHCFANLRIAFAGEEAELRFTLVSYAGFGAPPILDGTMPVSVSCGTIACRRDEAGDWRFARYAVTPLMVSAETFAKRAPAQTTA